MGIFKIFTYFGFVFKANKTTAKKTLITTKKFNLQAAYLLDLKQPISKWDNEYHV